MKERVSFIHEFINNCRYFYEDPIEFDQDVIKKRWNDVSVEFLKRFLIDLENSNITTKEEYDKLLHNICENMGIGVGKVIHALRVAVSGVGNGPGMFDILAILGKDTVVRRIKYALNNIGSN